MAEIKVAPKKRPANRDLTEWIGTRKWFVGMGERPAYERWTYWRRLIILPCSGVSR
jgi:hypothetical protein